MVFYLAYFLKKRIILVCMRILKLYFLLFLVCYLAGCAITPPHYSAITWKEREKILTGIQNWNINAVIAVRTSAGNQGGSANLQWQQKYKNYTILVFGPLGANLIKLSGQLSDQPGSVILETANGQKMTASSIEQLLAQQTGWQLPVSSLYYWIRGLSVPNLPAEKQFDPYFHLVKLNQQGWTVSFLYYTTINQIDLPMKILLENSRMKIKMNINQWNIG